MSRAYAALSGPHFNPINAVKYDWDAGQRLAVTSSSANTDTFDAETVIAVHATVDVFVTVGSGIFDPLAADTAGNLPIRAGTLFHFVIGAGQKMAFVRSGDTDGVVYILPVAAVA